MRAWVLALALGGCSFQATPASNTGGGDGNNVPVDAEADGASLDGKVAPFCLGTFVKVCVDPPQSAVTLATQTIDTSKSPLCAAYTTNPAVDACVIAGQSISIPGGATVTVTGGKKLILLSTDAITISGTLDAASHQGKTSGPAADAGPCPTTGFTNPKRGAQGGGGWGGTFGTAGNNGGNSASATGGIAPATVTTAGLRGGCPGSDGADNSFSGSGGGRGRGGGAVLLLATSTLTIDGTVNASGAGGQGGRDVLNGGGSGGGGGGGSGGMIVLEAMTVNIPGKCFANGGGGGGGSTGFGASSGGESNAPNSHAGGGGGGFMNGGKGGDGAFSTTGSVGGSNGSNSADNKDNGAGGAGGGGAGIIKIIATEKENTSDSAHVSPPAT